MFSNRRRLLMSVGVLCALIASVVFASTAMAAGSGEWGHKKNQWVVEGAALQKGETEPVKFWELGNYEGSQSMTFNWRWSQFISVRFSCSKGEGEGELIGPASGNTSLTLSGCTVQEPSTCSIEKGKIEFAPLQFNLSGNTATFSPKPGEPRLFVLRIAGAGGCAIPGDYIVQGSFTANLGPEGEEIANHFTINESSMSASPGEAMTMRGSLIAMLGIEPVATTEPATGTNLHGATLHGLVNPEGSPTTYHFEYGTTTAYGHSTPVESAGSGAKDVAVEKTVLELEPESTYHYRIAATNAAGTTYGSDRTFTTALSVPIALEQLPVLNEFNGSESSVADFKENWRKPTWVAEKGEDLSGGWRPNEALSNVAGTYYKNEFTDSGHGIGTVAVLNYGTGLERYFSLWGDMVFPSTQKTGYEARFTALATGNYSVTLSKWAQGSQTVLATDPEPGVSLPAGSSVALVDEGKTVSVWVKTGSGFTKLISATNQAYSHGNSGAEASGHYTRLTRVQAGSL